MSLKNEYWTERQGKIFSRTGGWRVGEHVLFNGEDLLTDIIPRDRYFKHLLRIATGESHSEELARWCEGAFLSMSWPDSRIWCNTVANFFGGLGTRPSAATLMGTMASDSVMYGGGASLGLIGSILDVGEYFKAGGTAKQLVTENLERNGGKLKLMGYSRPIATGDERVPVLIKLARDLGLAAGFYEHAAMAVNDYLLETLGESINVGGYIAVVMADQGISPKAFYQMYCVCTMAGVMACHADARDSLPNSHLPLKVDDVVFKGKAQRPLPESLA